MPELIVVPEPDEAGELVASKVVALVQNNPGSVLGVATGTTPLVVYRALRRHFEAGVDFSKVRAFALDEYVGLPAGHPESYASVIDREVRQGLGIPAAQVHVPDGDPAGLDNAGQRFEDAIAQAGGVDLQLLGIGATGHIGFNEPGSSLTSLTHVETLAEQTRIDNSRFFDTLADVPHLAVTQGVGTIMRARELVLLAFGQAKAQIVARALEGPISEDVPASALQMHPHLTVVLDEGAASQLKR